MDEETRVLHCPADECLGWLLILATVYTPAVFGVVCRLGALGFTLRSALAEPCCSSTFRLLRKRHIDFRIG